MTAPTQPPDPRVQRIADALDVWSDTVGYESHRRLARVLVDELGGREATVREIETVAEPVQRVTWGYDGAITATHNGAVYVLTGPEGARFEHKNLDTLILNWPQAAPHRAALETLAAQAQPSGKAGELDTRARVLVEELGGWESVKHATAETDNRIDGWHKVYQALWSAYPNMDAAMQAAPVHDRPALAIHQLAESLNACRAQQRENAETIAALKERVETAEAANTALDNARKSAEQSARDLRENNATLRAELDAITGAQPRFGSFRDGILSIHGTFKNDDRFDIYRHPAPALPVVGACVIGVLTAKTDDATNCISFHVDTSKYIPSKIVPPDGEYDIWLGAPLSTEGGK